MKIWNTLTGQKEEFKPITEGRVFMYNCGPTVYNFAHIGNLRSFLLADTLRKGLELEDFEVKQVMNITDVGHLTGDSDTGEDKVEKEALKEGKSAKDITDFYTQAFFADLDALNIDKNKILFPKATDHIQEQIDLIQKLETKGFTYTITDGVYFDTSKYSEYGKLGNINLVGLEEGARVEANAEKKNSTDFALWKLSKEGEVRQQEWKSPWGIGFPGWHLECSAMSMKYLGDTFDIHTGGIDHIPVHHNNEIAQSEVASGKPLAHYWIHGAFLNIKGGKMAKSEGNFITLETLREHGIHPLSYRYWLLTAHYRTQVDFTFEAVLGAQTAFTDIIYTLSNTYEQGQISEPHFRQFKEYMSDDLNTPQVIALIHTFLSDSSISLADKKATIFAFDLTLGLNIKKIITEISDIPEEITNLGEERDQKRKERDWSTSDAIREQIESKGYSVEDSTQKTFIRRKFI